MVQSEQWQLRERMCIGDGIGVCVNSIVWFGIQTVIYVGCPHFELDGHVDRGGALGHC